MQSNLKALFAGKREAVELPPPRGPGRPKKPRQDEAQDEALDVALAAVRHRALQNESCDPALLQLSPMRSPGKVRNASVLLAEAAGKTSIAEMRMPGAMPKRRNEGPQVKLLLCGWIEKTLVELGGSAESQTLVLAAAGEQWGICMYEVKKIFEQRTRWQLECDERGVTATGAMRDEAHLPRYLRKSRRCNGTVMRAKGGGRKDPLTWLYPLVRDYLETMRLHGKYIDAVDLEEQLMHLMQVYLDEAAKPGVEASMSPTTAGRVQVVRQELARLKHPSTSKGVHEHRQQQLMRACEARLRKPQRLTTLTLGEEHARWEVTLQAYDRLLWESLRPEEYLKDQLVCTKAWLEGIEDTVVCHCDQVPMWLRIGSLNQLYTKHEVSKGKAGQPERPVRGDEPGGQVMVCNEADGITQMRQAAASEADRFRVTLELSQLVRNVYRPGVALEVSHGIPLLIVPGQHARLSNISEAGTFIQDEVFEVKRKQKVRKAGSSAGNLMLSWRQLRDHGSEETKSYLKSIEVMQQPSAFADGVICSWTAEMRCRREAPQMVVVRDMFAGGLSQSTKRVSIVSNQLRSYICGKMTPVCQVTDVGVAGVLKKKCEAVKQEVRRAKRGEGHVEAAYRDAGKAEVRGSNEDLLKIVGEGFRRMKEEDEDARPTRLLQVTRACGWLSYQADPVRKVLVRTDEQDWFKGREEELAEVSNRHPHSWWRARYKWRDGEEPLRPDYKRCGKSVRGVEYMKDEFPEDKPHAEYKLNCLIGKKVVRNQDVDLTGDDMTFGEVGSQLIPDTFLRTQRERYEEARLRALVKATKPKEMRSKKLLTKMRRHKMRVKLKNKARRAALNEFLKEVRARKAEGYSVEQLMKSHKSALRRM